ncbi:hypothetical protein [Enterococcus sp. AZ007]|uniref:hypothetical protein n=1 Tax=Enterococcus sp. AZ007 TaxID=2774839 RepID=UPI003F28E9C5
MKKNIQTKPLTQMQLFVTKRDALEQKIISYFEHTKNVSFVIQYAVAIMIKNALVLSDYSDFLKELVRELFLTAEPSDVLRKNLPYFKPYFKSGEFDTVVHRLFSNKKAYFQFTEESRLNTNYLHAVAQAPAEISKYDYYLLAVFKASNGKRHTWTLRDINPAVTTEEVWEKTYRLLKLLTTLELFQQGDSWKFAQYVKFDYFENAKVMHHEEPKEDAKEPSQGEVQQESVQISEEPKEELTIMVPHGFDPRTLSDAEAWALVEAHLPEGKTVEDVAVVFVERQADSIEEQEPDVAPPSMSDFMQDSHAPSSASTKSEQPVVGVAEPPKSTPVKERSRKKRPLSGSQLSAQALINNRRDRQEGKTGKGSQKNNQKGKNGNSRKKKKRQK